MLEDVLEFLSERSETSLDEVAARFGGQNWSPAKLELLLLHLVYGDLIREPRRFNCFEMTDAGRDVAACNRQERARLKQRRLRFDEDHQ